jgi:acetyl esterase
LAAAPAAVRAAIAAAALALLLLGAPPVPAQGAVDVRRDVQFGVANGKPLLLDAYVPPGGTGRRPAVVLVHGGGWRAGDKSSFAAQAGRLAERGWVAFSINYRLDEPSMYPAEVDDVTAAVRWVRAHADEYRIDPTRIGALGESAGGHLTAMLATLGSGGRGTGARIAVGVAWSGPMDLTALARSRGDEWTNRIMGCPLAACPDRFASASPVTHVDGSDAPLLLFNSTDELVPLSQAEAMRARLDGAGVRQRLEVYPGNRHAMDYQDDAWPLTVTFLEEHLAAPARPAAADDSGRERSTLEVVLTVVAGALAVGGLVVRLAVLRRGGRRRGRDRSA